MVLCGDTNEVQTLRDARNPDADVVIVGYGDHGSTWQIDTRPGNTVFVSGEINKELGRPAFGQANREEIEELLDGASEATQQQYWMPEAVGDETESLVFGEVDEHFVPLQPVENSDEPAEIDPDLQDSDQAEEFVMLDASPDEDAGLGVEGPMVRVLGPVRIAEASQEATGKSSSTTASSDSPSSLTATRSSSERSKLSWSTNKPTHLRPCRPSPNHRRHSDRHTYHPDDCGRPPRASTRG